MATLFLRSSRTINMASKIIFTDEKLFKNNSSSKTEFCNRKVNDGYNLNQIQFYKSGSSSGDVNIWAYIGPFGKGKFYLLFLIK